MYAHTLQNKNGRLAFILNFLVAAFMGETPSVVMTEMSAFLRGIKHPTLPDSSPSAALVVGRTVAENLIRKVLDNGFSRELIQPHSIWWNKQKTVVALEGNYRQFDFQQLRLLRQFDFQEFRKCVAPLRKRVDSELKNFEDEKVDQRKFVEQRLNFGVARTTILKKRQTNAEELQFLQKHCIAEFLESFSSLLRHLQRLKRKLS